MREWLIALGILVIVAILLDGLRRMRNARRDALHMSLSMSRGVDRNGLDELDREFPSGGARVVSHRYDDEPVFSEEEDEAVQLAETARRRPIDLEQVAPILMDMDGHEQRQQRIEPAFDTEAEDFSEERAFTVVGDERADSLQIAQTANAHKASVHNAKLAVPVLDSATTPLSLGESDIIGTPRVYERPADKPAPRREPPVIKPSKPVIKAREERASQQAGAEDVMVQRAPQQMALEEVIIITVMARDRSGFPGAALLEILLSSGLRYGHRNIFHYYIGEDREDEALYSVVNVVKPGTFDINNMESFHAPGISLFLTLPAPGRAMEAFDSMLATARAVADQLNGELRDENRSVMMGQTIEHCRQRIRDFEMQSRLRAR